MAEQLLGVLRQVVALDGRTPAPAPSTLFSGELGAGSEPGAWADLPVPTVDPFDPAAALLATAALSAPEQARAILDGAPRSPELAFHLARAAIEEGDFPRAEQELESPEAAQGGWRVAWWRGVLHLAAGRAREAQSFFRAVAAELPGELAPKLAQAVAFETAPAGPEDLGEAERYFHIVATTDPSFSSACFGLARARLAAGDRAGAAGALGLVPSSSSSHAAAQLALCQTLSANGPATIAPTLSDLTTASVVLERLRAEPAVRLPLVLEVQNQALDLLLGGRLAPEATVVVAGAPLTEVDLRLGLERTYRSLAKLAATDEERCDLIDRANAHRPRSLT
jgi:serine/threonine-protein kinase PknG